MRTLLPVLLAPLVLAACGGGNATLAVGDCTDVDPTFVVEAITPDKVECGSKDARSKVAAKEDSKDACRTEAMIQQGSTYYCLEPVGKTFRDKLDETSTTATDLQDTMDELKKELDQNGSKKP